MDLNLISRLREQVEPLAALSLSHLTPATRKKLLDDELSVNAYPTAVSYTHLTLPTNREV